MDLTKFNSMSGRQELYEDILSRLTNQMHWFFSQFARLIGFPKGMPASVEISTLLTDKDQTVLPVYKPQSDTEIFSSWSEVIWGHLPKSYPIPRFFFTDTEHGLGYYNFYFIRYKNMFFLPDQISEFLQVNNILDCGTSLDKLEVLRESIFIGLTFYMLIVNIRALMFWFLSINTYVIPWILLNTFVDWSDDLIDAISPVITGVSVGTLILTTLTGILADSVNRFVFTMPYLPSEGYKTMRLIDDQERLIPTIQFDGLPQLWYQHTIPNIIREYWFYNEPKIFAFMYRTYPELQILPDGLTVNEISPVILKKLEVLSSGLIIFN